MTVMIHSDFPCDKKSCCAANSVKVCVVSACRLNAYNVSTLTCDKSRQSMALIKKLIQLGSIFYLSFGLILPVLWENAE